MATQDGPDKIVIDGLIFAGDAGNDRCYKRYATSMVDISPAPYSNYSGSVSGKATGSLGPDQQGSWYFQGSSNTGVGVTHHNDRVLLNYDFGIPETITFSWWMHPIAFVTRTMFNSAPDLSAFSDQKLEIHFEQSGLVNYHRNGANERSSLTAPINEWSHWVCAQDASGGTVNIYKNGIFDVGRTCGSTSKDAQSSFLIGDGHYGCFRGYLACVFIYNKQLSALEVKQNYNAHKSRFGH
jgi:hypothetical protein